MKIKTLLIISPRSTKNAARLTLAGGAHSIVLFAILCEWILAGLPAVAAVPPPIRDGCNVRIGAFLRSGTGQDGKLTAADRVWIAHHLDIVVLNPPVLSPADFPAMQAMNPRLICLLHLDAGGINPTGSDRVSDWHSTLQKWGMKVPRNMIGPQYRLMNPANVKWAEYWRDAAARLVIRYHAHGVVADHLPTDRDSLFNRVGAYRNETDRVKATRTWLKTVKRNRSYLLVAAANGFAAPAEEDTPYIDWLVTLAGSLWNDFDSLVNGVFVKGWQSWGPSGAMQNERDWEINTASAQRFSRQGRAYLAIVSFKDQAELESLIASYLMAYHTGCRFSLEPVPTSAFREDGSISLAALKSVYYRFKALFSISLGRPLRDRFRVHDGKWRYWVRPFEKGMVIFNPS
ncbi:MAG: putative glycoside hydrolase, partial [Armatimonadetes bacterium]|nr:putative glycoside hydrolase [Armatimonadota bacterium]